PARDRSQAAGDRRWRLRNPAGIPARFLRRDDSGGPATAGSHRGGRRIRCAGPPEPSRGAERASGLGAVRRGPCRGRRPGGARRAATGLLTGCGVNRVVLADPAGDVRPVAARLEEMGGARPERAPAVPSGPGVVALLVPPEVAVGAAELARLPDLRIVAATATGYDHLDLHAIAAAGVWATHCPGYCSEEV